MEPKIDIFILMAGKGSRFRQRGFDIPKPLVQYRGAPLFTWAIKSVKELLPYANLHLVVCAEDDIQEKVEVELAKQTDLVPKTVQIISLPKRTKGPLDTAVQAAELASVNSNDNAIIFGDCDLYFESSDWIKSILQWSSNQNPFDAVLTTYVSEVENRSFVKTDDQGLVVQVAEKKVISNSAIVGFYTFKSAVLFLKNAKTILEQNSSELNEHYISHVYSEMIATGKKIMTFKSDIFFSLGTPDEIEALN